MGFLAGYTRHGSKRHAMEEPPKWSENAWRAACGAWAETDGWDWDPRHPDACRRCVAAERRRLEAKEE